MLTVTGPEYCFSKANEYQTLGLARVQTSFVIEALRRNTAPTFAMAAFTIAERN